MTGTRQARHKARSRDLADLVRRVQAARREALPGGWEQFADRADVAKETAVPAGWEQWDLGAWLIVDAPIARRDARRRAAMVAALAERDAARMNLQSGALADTVEAGRKLSRMLDPGPAYEPLRPVAVVAAASRPEPFIFATGAR